MMAKGLPYSIISIYKSMRKFKCRSLFGKYHCKKKKCSCQESILVKTDRKWHYEKCHFKVSKPDSRKHLETQES